MPNLIALLKEFPEGASVILNTKGADTIHGSVVGKNVVVFLDASPDAVWGTTTFIA